MDDFRRPLDAIFSPRSIAVIGATERVGSVGRTLFENLLGSPFRENLFPINPCREAVLGLKAFPDLRTLSRPVDLAIIAVRAEKVPAVIGDCVETGVRGAIILSAGFKEIGPPGRELEKRILEEARRGKLRIIGPNCLGIMRPHSGLNATFAKNIALPGRVAFISQSGALGTAILDWSLRENVGFSAFISHGSMLDVDWGDLIDYFSDDPHTQSIVLYMESVGDAGSFLSAAREAALAKPIIVIKAGRTEAAAKAAASHTGAMTGSDEVLDAAFRRCGVLRVETIEDLFLMAELLAKQPLPRGPRLTILTNAGGPGVLSTDALMAKGGKLAPLSPSTLNAFNHLLPPYWSHENPIDLLGDADPERYVKAVEIALAEKESDGLLMILTPQAMTDPTGTAERFKNFLKDKPREKPILASWMGGKEVERGGEILNAAGIPTFPYPDTAAEVFCAMWQDSENLRILYETPALPMDSKDRPLDPKQAFQIIQAHLQSNQTLLNEYESKKLLEAYGIPTVPTRIAKSEAEAAQIAPHLGYPVVLKVFSQTITHKSDVGGVKLHLKEEKEVREAYREIEKSVGEKFKPEDFLGVTIQPMIQNKGLELILGSSIDPQFGPVILFGAGGEFVEIFKDRALALPPLNRTLARRLIEGTKVFQALRGVRGRKPVNLESLEALLVRFSRLVVEQPRIKEIDINPLLASAEGLLALDARVILHDPSIDEAHLPQPAIRPYPFQYVTSWKLKNGRSLSIRPIRPEDEPLMVKFHETLSDQSVYARYFRPVQLSERIERKQLSPLCFIDYRRHMALVAVQESSPETSEILGVGRIIKLHGVPEAEFALLVADRFQRQGLGTELLQRLLAIAREEKLRRVTGLILSDNRAMQKICEKLGFEVKFSKEEGLVKAQIDLEF
jgi:acetyltransferase